MCDVCELESMVDWSEVRSFHVEAAAGRNAWDATVYTEDSAAHGTGQTPIEAMKDAILQL